MSGEAGEGVFATGDVFAGEFGSVESVLRRVKGCEADTFGFVKDFAGAFDGGVDPSVVGDEADAFSFEVLKAGGGENVDAEAHVSGGVERVWEGEEWERGEEGAAG